MEKPGSSHDGAESAALASFLDYLNIKFARHRSRRNQEHSFKIVRSKGTRLPFDFLALRPGAYLRGRLGCDDAHFGISLEQTCDLGFADAPGADDKARPPREFQKHRKKLEGFHLFAQVTSRRVSGKRTHCESDL